jgi:thiamine kinase-like enzyme
MIPGDEAAGFTPEAAAVVLAEACRIAELNAGGADLVRLGSNAVYRLRARPVIARIARDAGELPAVERTVRVARWLAEVGFPAARVVAEVRQPLVVDGRVVTFWESAQDSEEWANLPELAELLRRLHRLAEPESLGLPTYDPFGPVWDRLARLRGVAVDDREWLRQRAEELRKQYDRLDFVLPYGVIHGDANVGNAIRDREGRALLIDLDRFAVGNREWDLVLTALYYERFGWHTREEYESFVFHYGFDLLKWPGFPVLADLRELTMAVWLGGQVAGDPLAGEEFAKRMRALRTGGSRRDWQPF